MAEQSGWFPFGQNNQPGWRLDIVSLLAVIGESSMGEHAQTVTSSWLCLLPRLIPAPQALLKSDRPKRMPPVPGVTVIGAFSGTKVSELNFAANLVHEIDDLPPLAFQEFTITYRYDDRGRTQTRIKMDQDTERAASTQGRYEEQRLQYLNKQGIHEKEARLKARHLSPLNLLTIGSTALTIALFIWSFFLQDGVAALSIACMACASTLTGVASWWQPKLASRPSKTKVPKGDLVIKTRAAGFVVVHCEEEIARELYTGRDNVEYFVSDRVSKVLVGLGTLFLMVAVVLLGNCNWTMQAAIGVTYLVLNGAYWTVALIPQRLSWHIQAYKVVMKDDLPLHIKNAHEAVDMGGHIEPPSYTRTLWYAIHRSKGSKWLIDGEAAPQTDAWKEWIRLALENVDNPDWPAVEVKNRLMEKYLE